MSLTNGVAPVRRPGSSTRTTRLPRTLTLTFSGVLTAPP